MVSFISDLIEDAVILFSESLLLISVFFIGMLASVFFVLSALAIFLSFTTSLRSSWHKRRLQKTTLVAGRKDVSLFPKKLIDKKFEGLFRSTKPQFTKKELKEYMKLKKETEKRKEKEEEEGIEEGKDEEEGGEREIEGALSLLGAGVWIPRFAVLSLSGYLSFLSSSASDDDDCDLLGQIKLRGCCVRRDKKDETKRTFIIKHKSNQSIFCVSVGEEIDSAILPDSLSYGVTDTVTLRAPSEKDAKEWISHLQEVIKKLPPWGFFPEPTFPYFKKGKLPQDVSFLNVLLQRIFTDIQTFDGFQADIHKTIKKKIDNLVLPAFIGPIIVDHIETGQSFIQLEKAICEQPKKNEFIIQAFGNYSGGAGVDISTELILTETMRISIDLSVRIRKFEGVVNVYAPAKLGDLWSLFLPIPPEPENFDADVNIKLGGINICYVFPLLKSFLKSCVYRAIGFVLTWPGRVTICFPFPGRKFDVEPEPYESKIKIKRIGHRRPRPTDSDSSKDIERKFLIGHYFEEVFWKKNFEEMENIFTPNCTITGFSPYFLEQEWEIVGPAAMTKAVRHLMNALSDTKIYIVDMALPRVGFGNPNSIYVRFKIRGIHTDPLWNIPPSRKRIVLEGFLLAEVNSDCKIMDQAWYWSPDSLFSIFPQLSPKLQEAERDLEGFEGRELDEAFFRRFSKTA
eukprot:CAMPEP_0201486276 /NCGR_PEP_ID=MMETSP0151_2-20130828/10336_1 /ASSEMBLY_ACC=CAM_ASM_000257 /TAXON_ID=200890 /ORGANISM="Paramoeba atlantica, Strain 621/1 / CCAP 1560/9" /LENGTH=682 /DNA_ID=CAMNT_0047870829 /DNA_START=177 /DNA_END=2225 /DNA_ORIENTATION=+